MAENSLLGSAIVAVLGLAAMLWLPSRIRSVWHGERSAPWLPIRTTDRFLGQKVFEVTDRNFPAFGTAMLCMGGFAFCLGASSLVRLLGFPGLQQPIVMLGVTLLPVGLGFAFIAGLIHWIGSPVFLIPPALREPEDGIATRSEGEPTARSKESVSPETATPTDEHESASPSGGILDSNGLLDRAVIVVIAVITGFVSGVPVWLVVSGVSVGVGLAAGILVWIGAGAYLIRRRTLNAAVSKAAYVIAIAIMSVSLVVFTPTWRSDVVVTLPVDFVLLAVLCAIPAAVVGGVGVLAERYIPEPSPDG